MAGGSDSNSEVINKCGDMAQIYVCVLMKKLFKPSYAWDCGDDTLRFWDTYKSGLV